MRSVDLERLGSLPFTGKVSPAACLGKRTTRPECPCCGGHCGVRRAGRKIDWLQSPERWTHAGELITRGRKPRSGQVTTFRQQDSRP